MDEQNLPKAVSVGEIAPKRRTLRHAGSSLAFFGNPALVQEGFAIALRAMGVDQPEPGDPDA